ncbi:hypothetical protein TC41_2440 [Alicyclobacillus acidocaldarius subsp. acidocaldarius Tc-4-1]|uniref:Uncharacterized protein n=1 Tax=Alicyclobacillus acidocaldarius (strain Tc-4-1) TaxID=1048834 RepID=F8IGY5_ALIAT|nr:hypothetical protein TC41_2440 [Alicyclobacillus acidocaldarius subsp. acidocaldarius Tc-4-1]
MKRAQRIRWIERAEWTGRIRWIERAEWTGRIRRIKQVKSVATFPLIMGIWLARVSVGRLPVC